MEEYDDGADLLYPDGENDYAADYITGSGEGRQGIRSAIILLLLLVIVAIVALGLTQAWGKKYPWVPCAAAFVGGGLTVCLFARSN